MTRFPKRIYVTWEVTGAEKYLVASAEPDAEDGEPVAVYELAETRKMTITKELV